jgi:N-methylhydantoinase A/oxoprolinase/acetone carboxylase beta subunit
VAGGHEFTGREISALDTEQVKRVANRSAAAGLPIAVVGVFSAVNPEHERRVAEICSEVAGPAHPISLSSEIGSIGFLERENATILNSALTDIARKATGSFEEAVREACGPARRYFTQNDGTLMPLEYALRYPSLMLASGPANSMRGAAYLSGSSDGIVIDVGGTTTDIGVLVHGFPREAPLAVEIGGVRTNFRMPDVVSLALGGGTIVRQEKGRIRLGPESVGFELTKQALAFGGAVSTFTDVAIVLGHAKLGAHRPEMDAEMAAEAYALAMQRLERGVERMRPSSESLPPLPLVAEACFCRNACKTGPFSVPLTSWLPMPSEPPSPKSAAASTAWSQSETEGRENCATRSRRRRA